MKTKVQFFLYTDGLASHSQIFQNCPLRFPTRFSPIISIESAIRIFIQVSQTSVLGKKDLQRNQIPNQCLFVCTRVIILTLPAAVFLRHSIVEAIPSGHSLMGGCHAPDLHIHSSRYPKLSKTAHKKKWLQISASWWYMCTEFACNETHSVQLWPGANCVY